MLTIERCDVMESIAVGDLFEQVGFPLSIPADDESGDSYVKNDFGIEVLSSGGYYAIEGFRWTKPEKQVRLYHIDVPNAFSSLAQIEKFLQCSPEHVVFAKRYSVGGLWTKSEWMFVKDLKANDFVYTQHGISRVTKIEDVDGEERLCDLQVADVHSYYADDVLSHNSHFLTMLGANAIRNGVNVLHYTMELSECAIGLRYDSNLCSMNSNLVIENKEKVLETYRSQKLGKLIIKEFPTNSATIYTLRAHIERLDCKGFQPGLILIDYADIMRSSRQYESLRHELKLIYEELRGFASEKKVPIWTASQANKEGSTAEFIDLSNMSEAYGKAMVADVVLSISRRAFEKSTGLGRLYVAKNRAGRDGLQFPVTIDTSQSKFVITGEAGGFQEAASDEAKVHKQQLRDKWEELKREKIIKTETE